MSTCRRQARKKRSMPPLSKIQKHWWQPTESGLARFEAELWPTDVTHPMLLTLWGERGAANVCFACYMTTGRSGSPWLWLHRGHIVAECRGGSTDLSNLVPLCARCNLAMPIFDNRQEALDWMSERQPWSAYLELIDSVTPAHISRHQVVADAAKGIDWTPSTFAEHYGKEAR